MTVMQSSSKQRSSRNSVNKMNSTMIEGVIFKELVTFSDGPRFFS